MIIAKLPLRIVFGIEAVDLYDVPLVSRALRVAERYLEAKKKNIFCQKMTILSKRFFFLFYEVVRIKHMTCDSIQSLNYANIRSTGEIN